MEKVDLKQRQIKDYLFSKQQIICRINVEFTDMVDRKILETAVNKALNWDEYFRKVYYFRKDILYSEINHNFYKINPDMIDRAIPDNTDGFLFDVVVNGKYFILTFDHMLADGKGIRLFVTNIVNFYCEEKYGTMEADENHCLSEGIVDSAFGFISYTDKLQKQRLISYNVDGMKNRSFYPHGEKYIVRMSKRDWNDAAVRYHVRPFILMIAIVNEAFRQAYGGCKRNFAFPVDMRTLDNKDVSTCPYCVTPVTINFEYGEYNSIEEQFHVLEELVNHSITADSMKETDAKMHGWIDEILNLPKRMPIKRRMIQMGMELYETEFWISYNGNLLQMIDREWRKYVSDYQMWAPPAFALLGIETGAVHDRREMWIESRKNVEGFVEIMSQLIRNLGIEIQTEQL